MTAAASAMPASVVTLPAGTQLPSGRTASATLNQNDFLTLLTTQLQKQNPLNPASPSDLASELAQFSTATGVQNLNTALAADSGMQAASLVGRNVAMQGNALVLGQAGAAGLYGLTAPAKDVAVTIADPAGKLVATLDLGAASAGTQSFTWDGKGLDGSAAPPGLYQFNLAAVDASGKSMAATAYSVAPVTSVALNGASGPLLELGGGLGSVALSAVQQVF